MRFSSPLHARVLGLVVLCSIKSSALAGSGDEFYAMTFPSPSTLYRVDWPTGAVSPLAPIAGIEPTDVALSPGGTLYACTTDRLYTLNPATGTAALVGQVSASGPLTGLDFSSTGTLYACTENGDVLTIDPATAAATTLFNTGFFGGFGADLAWKDSSTMYALLEGGVGSMLVKIDLTGSGNHTFLGPVAIGLDFWSLDFDATGNLIAIAKVGDVYWIQSPATSGAGTFVAATGQTYFGGMTSAIGGCPALANFCTSGTTSHGCLASISGAGTPSASMTSGFTLTVSSVEPIKQGILFYGIDNAGFTPLPWGAGTSFLCVKPPVQRTGVQNSGGVLGSCSGTLSIDWNAFMATHPGALGTPLASGQTVFAQGWFRDPPTPKSTSLSDALSFLVCP